MICRNARTLFIAACLTVSALFAPIPRAAVAQGLPAPVVPQGFGVCIHFTVPRPGEMEAFGQAGFGCARMDMIWSGVEKSRGVYDFRDYDTLVNDLAAVHCRVMYILDYYNAMYDGGVAPHTDVGRAGFARFAAAAATHFQGRGVIWEIWNEPNGEFWKPTPDVENYALLAVAVAHAVRTADPHACIIAPATSEVPLDFLRTMFRHGLLDDLDAVSIHPYRGRMPETAAADYLALHKLIAACTTPGRLPIPIVCSEWGYPAHPTWGTTNGAASPITEEIQARYLLRIWLSNLAVGVNLSDWYDWREDGTDPNNPECRFGTVREDGAPKPAYLLAKALIRDLSGFRFVHRLTSKSPDDWRLLFCRGDKLAVVSWTTDLQASADAQTPQVRSVAPVDPEYAALRAASLVRYGSAPLTATPANPARCPITVINPENVSVRALIAVGGEGHALRLAPYQHATTVFSLRGDIASGQDAVLPVAATLGGKPVLGLPPVVLATVSPLDLSVVSDGTGRRIHMDALGAPFTGTIRIVTDGGTTVLPLTLAPFTSVTLSQDVGPAKEIRVAAIDEQGRLIALLPPNSKTH